MTGKSRLPAIVLALVVAAGLHVTRGPEPAGRTVLPFMAAGAQTTDAALPAVDDMVLGHADAPVTVTVTEYGSHTCPHCASFHAPDFARLKSDYPGTGKMRFVFREVSFDRSGLWAAMVARCGGATQYSGIHSILHDKQQEWAADDGPNAVAGNLAKIGKSAGMDDATPDTCMKDTSMAQAMINALEANLAADAVEGTPSLFINGVRHGNMGWPDPKPLIDAELAKG